MHTSSVHYLLDISRQSLPPRLTPLSSLPPRSQVEVEQVRAQLTAALSAASMSRHTAGAQLNEATGKV